MEVFPRKEAGQIGIIVVEYTKSKIVKIGKFPCSEKMGRFLMEVFLRKEAGQIGIVVEYTKSKVVKIGKFPCGEKMGRFLMEVFSQEKKLVKLVW